MENTTALTLVCKHINTECKEPEIIKLRKQKHASQQSNYRLRKQFKKQEVTNKILSSCIVAINNHNNTLTHIIPKYHEQMNNTEKEFQ